MRRIFSERFIQFNESEAESNEVSKLREDRLLQGLCPECGREARGDATKLGPACLARKAEASRRSRRLQSQRSGATTEPA